jgi:poly-gamma-glutamate synthesis protein (capsule biosynthesis protein)
VPIHDVKIGVFAYSFIGDPAANPLYNKVDNEDRIIQDIRALRDVLDLVVVILHWGEEYVHSPSPEQVRIGRSLVDHGADIILGAHPHVLQGYEIYNRRLIVYSLGNFIFENFIDGTQWGMLAQIDVHLPGMEISMHPVPIIPDRKEFYPRLAGKSDRSQIMDLIGSINRKIQGVSTPDYAAGIGDYRGLVRRCRRSANLQMKWYFLKNLPRYPLNVSTGILMQYLKKLGGR